MTTINMIKRTLVCNRCGKYAPGRQWWNRDTGYGLCKPCGDELVARDGLASVEFDNGQRGFHWGLEAA